MLTRLLNVAATVAMSPSNVRCDSFLRSRCAGPYVWLSAVLLAPSMPDIGLGAGRGCLIG